MSGGAPGRVRRAQPDDLAGLAALWLGIGEHHVPLDPSFRLRPGAEGEVRELLGALLRDPDAAAFVCEEDGELAGLCIARVDRAPAILAERARAEITDLGVRADRRRRGVGRVLAEAALGWIAGRGASRVEVRVASRNAEGQAFWRALGFDDLMDVLQRRL